MKLITTHISLAELENMSHSMGGLVKAVVDIEQKIMVVDADLHADEEKFLLAQGSNQDNLWGINLYPAIKGEEFIEFDSMINIRPRLKNMSRRVENEDLQNRIRTIVDTLIVY